LKFDWTIFYTILDNAIVRRPYQFNGQDSMVYEGVRSRVQALQNVAQATVWGVQAGIEYEVVKKLVGVVRLNYIDGRETDDTQNKQVKLRHAPPFHGSVAVKFDNKTFLAELNTQFNGAISAGNLAPSEQAKPFIYATDANGQPYSPGWYTINFKASYKASENVQVSMGLENITDRRYRPYSSGKATPGINFVFSVKEGI